MEIHGNFEKHGDLLLYLFEGDIGIDRMGLAVRSISSPLKYFLRRR